MLAKAGCQSPDGQWTAFLHDSNIWIECRGTGVKRRLKSDAGTDLKYGAVGAAYGVEMWGGPQIAWSSDSKRLLTVLRDQREIITLPVVQHVPDGDSVRLNLDTIPVAYSGDSAIETFRVLAIDLTREAAVFGNYTPLSTTRNSNGLVDTQTCWWSQDGRHSSLSTWIATTRMSKSFDSIRRAAPAR